MLLLVAALQFPPTQNFPEINRPGTYADLRGSVARACRINEVAPMLNVSRVDKGGYALEVRLTDAEGKVVARRRGWWNWTDLRHSG